MQLNNVTQLKRGWQEEDDEEEDLGTKRKARKRNRFIDDIAAVDDEDEEDDDEVHLSESHASTTSRLILLEHIMLKIHFECLCTLHVKRREAATARNGHEVLVRIISNCELDQWFPLFPL